jgi:peptidyl-prolyl cis-trans isomerase SurA
MKKLITLLLLSFFIIPNAPAETIDKIVAKVGTEVITLSDVNQEKIKQRVFLIETLGNQEGLKKYNKIKLSILDEMILNTLLKEEINKAGIASTDQEEQQLFNNYLKRSGKNEKEFIESLAKKKLSVTSFKQLIRFEIERQKYIQKTIMPKISITDYDLKQEYETNKNRYQTYTKLRFIETYLTNDSFSSEQELVAMAKKIHRTLKAGGNASPLIKKHSSGAFAKKGGDSGLVEGSSLRPEIQNILNSLKKGQTSEPVSVQSGVFIFKLLSKAAPQALPLNMVINDVRMSYAEKAMEKELKKHLLNIKDMTYVEILP